MSILTEYAICHVWVVLRYIISASLSVSIASVRGTDLSPDHLSVCVFAGSESVLWQNGWKDPDAFWDGEWGQLRDRCIRRGRRAAREAGMVSMGFAEFFPIRFNGALLSRNILDSCVKSWQYFPTDKMSLETSFHWLSE